VSPWTASPGNWVWKSTAWKNGGIPPAAAPLSTTDGFARTVRARWGGAMEPVFLPWMMAGAGYLRPWSTGTLNVLAGMCANTGRGMRLRSRSARELRPFWAQLTGMPPGDSPCAWIMGRNTCPSISWTSSGAGALPRALPLWSSPRPTAWRNGSTGPSRTKPSTAVSSGTWRKSERQLELLSPGTTVNGGSKKSFSQPIRDQTAVDGLSGSGECGLKKLVSRKPGAVQRFFRLESTEVVKYGSSRSGRQFPEWMKLARSHWVNWL